MSLRCLYAKQVASLTVLREPFLWETGMNRESRNKPKPLSSLQRLCLFRLVFTGDRRAIGLQGHNPFLQNFGAPSPCAGLLDALTTHLPRKAAIFV